MGLNPVKYTLDVGSRKFLGFLITTKDIKMYPNKVKAILDILLPRTTKEV